MLTYSYIDPGAAPAFSLLPGPVVTPSGTKDNSDKSGTVPEIPGQLEPMVPCRKTCTNHDNSLYYRSYI